MNQLSLAHSSWRSQKNIGLLISTSKKLISLFLPITEVLARYNTDYYERIEHSHQLFAKLIIRFRLYKFYNRGGFPIIKSMIYSNMPVAVLYLPHYNGDKTSSYPSNPISGYLDFKSTDNLSTMPSPCLLSIFFSSNNLPISLQEDIATVFCIHLYNPECVAIKLHLIHYETLEDREAQYRE